MPAEFGVRCPSCGEVVSRPAACNGRVSPVAVSLPHVPGFRIVSCIGRGAMGLVLEAVQTSLDRRVAIKVLAPELANNPTFIARFEREATALAQLTHPNIITIFERGRTDQSFYLIMEYVDGPGGGPPTDLRRMIDERSLTPVQTRRLILQVVRALEFAHQQKIIHRDIKPSNILIDRHGNAKVADFGIAAVGLVAERQLTTIGTMGTPDYMAPEQRRSAAGVDERADIFSVGVMLYEMLTGELPLGSYPSPSQVIPDLDPAWDAVVRRALQPRLEDRYANMTELAADLEQLADDRKTAEPPALDPDKRRRFVQYRESGKSHLESARAEAAPLAERLTHAEQASLALARAAKYEPGDSGTQELLVQVNGLWAALAWQGADLAYRQQRFGEALPLLERLREIEPGHPGAAAHLADVKKRRDDLLAQVQALIKHAKLKKAVRVLEEANQHFAGDAEITDLLARLRRKADLAEAAVQERIPRLLKEKRLCELVEVLEELQHEGIAIKGLDDQAERLRSTLGRMQTLCASAQKQLDQGRYAEVRATAEKILQTVSDHAQARQLAELAEERLQHARGTANPERNGAAASVHRGAARTDRNARLLVWGVMGAGAWLLSGGLAFLLVEKSAAPPQLGGLAPEMLQRTLALAVQMALAIGLLGLVLANLKCRLSVPTALVLLAIGLAGASLTGLASSWLEAALTSESPASTLALSATWSLYGAAAASILLLLTAQVMGQKTGLPWPQAIWAGVVGALVGSWARTSNDAAAAHLIAGLIFSGLLAATGIGRGPFRLLWVAGAASAAAGLELWARRGNLPWWNGAFSVLAETMLLTLAGARVSSATNLPRLAALVGLAAAAVLGARLALAATLAPPPGVLLGVWFLLLDTGTSAWGEEREMFGLPFGARRNGGRVAEEGVR
jgi:serine/threonine protein kinase